MSWFTSPFKAKVHGNQGRKLYDSYLSSPTLLSDLSNKVVAITGTTEGSLGYYIAEAAVAKNAKLVLLLNRKSDRATLAENKIRSLNDDNEEGAPVTVVQTIYCDLASISSVERAAEELNGIAKEHGGLDVLCNNAGVFALKDVRTDDAFDIQMQTNHLSHFLLTKLMLESLELAADNRGEARVVMQSSGYKDVPRNLEEKFFLKCEPCTLGGDSAWEFTDAMGWTCGPVGRYHHSKLANSAFSMALHAKLQASGSKVKSLGCIPGISTTNVQETTIKNGGMSHFAGKLLVRFGHSAADGSLSAIVACFGPDAKSGDFYMPERIVKGAPIKSISEGVPVKKGDEKLTCDKKNQKIAWESSEEGLGIQFKLGE